MRDVQIPDTEAALLWWRMRLVHRAAMRSTGAADSAS